MLVPFYDFAVALSYRLAPIGGNVSARAATYSSSSIRQTSVCSILAVTSLGRSNRTLRTKQRRQSVVRFSTLRSSTGSELMAGCLRFTRGWAICPDKDALTVLSKRVSTDISFTFVVSMASSTAASARWALPVMRRAVMKSCRRYR